MHRTEQQYRDDRDLEEYNGGLEQAVKGLREALRGLEHARNYTRDHSLEEHIAGLEGELEEIERRLPLGRWTPGPEPGPKETT